MNGDEIRESFLIPNSYELGYEVYHKEVMELKERLKIGIKKLNLVENLENIRKEIEDIKKLITIDNII